MFRIKLRTSSAGNQDSREETWANTKRDSRRNARVSTACFAGSCALSATRSGGDSGQRRGEVVHDPGGVFYARPQMIGAGSSGWLFVTEPIYRGLPLFVIFRADLP
jgi:hypothetical protein